MPAPLAVEPEPDVDENASIGEVRAALSAVTRALQDAYDEYAYARRRLDAAEDEERFTRKRRDRLINEQALLTQLLEQMQRESHGPDDATATSQAGESPAEDAGNRALRGLPGYVDLSRRDVPQVRDAHMLAAMDRDDSEEIEAQQIDP